VVRYFDQRVQPGAHVLVLGCTPELRSICHRKGAKVVVLDRSREVYDNVDGMLNERGEEIFFQGDWRNFQTQLRFDFVFGHGSLSMLDFEGLEQVLQNVSSLLRPSGECVFQIHTYGAPRFSTAASVVDHFRAEHMHQIFTATWFDIANLVNDTSKGGFNYLAWKSQLANELKSGLLSQADYEALMKPLQGHDIDIFLHDESKLEAAFKKHFSRIERYHSKDYPRSEFHPIFAMVRE